MLRIAAASAISANKHLHLIRHGFAVPPSPQEKAHDGRRQPNDKPKFEILQINTKKENPL